MRFRDDIDLENTWVTSDTHFGHENIIGFCFRPEDHEQVMIAQWRATVPEDGTVLHLGDVCYGHKGGNTRFRRLTSQELTGGRKLLIAGNHDNQRFSFYRDSGFKVVKPFALRIGCTREGVFLAESPDDAGWQVSFSHYPWDEATEGPKPANAVRIHGHIHNNGYSRSAFVPFLRSHINLSVEQTRYTPVNLKVLLDAYLCGIYEETTPEQIAAARVRRERAIAESRQPRA